jgi:hypothetical protein
MKYTYKEITKLYDNFRTTKVNSRLRIKKITERSTLLKKHTSNCFSHYNFEDLQHQLFSLDPAIFSDSLENQFTCNNMLMAIICIIYAVTISNNPYIIRHWFKGFKRIGDDSAHGIASLTSFGKVEDVFVVKTPKDRRKPHEWSHYEDISHETFIGLYGTNQLREKIPNIAYIFGSFFASPLYCSDSDEVLTWGLSPKNKVHYVIYEKIFPSIDFKRAICNCSEKRFVNLYLQVLLTLGVANNAISFSHNDLHAGNVLIRDVSKKEFELFFPAYGGTSKDIYLKCQSIATFIDLGLSHIVYEGKDYGPFGYECYGITNDSSFIFGDAYRLLMFLYDASKAYKNKEVSRVIARIFRFFSDENIDLHRKKLSPYYILPPKEPYAKMHMSTFVDYITEEFAVIVNDMISETKHSSSLYINDNISTNEWLTRLGVSGKLEPSSVFELYNIAWSNINNEQMPLVLETFRSDIMTRVKKDLKYLRMVSQDILERMIFLRRSMNINKRPELYMLKLPNSTVIEKYFQQIEMLIRLWDEFLIINLMYESLDYVIWQYGIVVSQEEKEVLRSMFWAIIGLARECTDEFMINYRNVVKPNINVVYDTWMKLFERYAEFFLGISYETLLDSLGQYQE